MSQKLDKLAQLERKQQQLQAQIQNLKARERSKAEKEETRRKILVGAYTLDGARENGTYEKLVAALEGYLTRDSDRKLFGLADKPKSTTNVGAKANESEAHDAVV